MFIMLIMFIMFTYNIFFVRAASIDGLVPFLVAWLLCQINIIIDDNKQTNIGQLYVNKRLLQLARQINLRYFQTNEK